MSPKLRILVGEDDTFYAKIFQLKLTKEGYDVCIASNGEEVVALSRSYKPKLILLDLIMPRKNGFDALAELQNDTSLSSIPVIVFSNLSQDEDIAKATSLGAKHYMVKSNVSIQEMLEAVKKFAI